MSTDSAYCIVLTTTSDAAHASALAKAIINDNLAACVQLQNIHSYYAWNGLVHSDPECLLIIKTTNNKYTLLENFIINNHTYDTPEIIQISINSGYTKYLDWIDQVTRD